jgi:hypothetical protein
VPDSYSDRHLEMADELRDVIGDMLPPAAQVDRVYDPDVFSLDWPENTRRVWIFPTSEEDVERLTRRRVLTEYGFDLAFGSKYTDPAQAADTGTVPNLWVDNECGWVRQNVYTPLNDRVRKRDRIIETAWPQSCRIAMKFDPERLRTKVFWSVVQVTFREEREG